MQFKGILTTCQSVEVCQFAFCSFVLPIMLFLFPPEVLSTLLMSNKNNNFAFARSKLCE